MFCNDPRFYRRREVVAVQPVSTSDSLSAGPHEADFLTALQKASLSGYVTSPAPRIRDSKVR